MYYRPVVFTLIKHPLNPQVNPTVYFQLFTSDKVLVIECIVLLYRLYVLK